MVADLERKLLWPTEGYNLPDFVLSIGTAQSPTSRRKLLERSSKINAGVFGHAKNMATIAVDHVRSSLDSEKTWTDYILQLPDNQKSRYQRINPEISEDLPALDDVLKMHPLQKGIREKLTGHTSISSVAHRLIATSFFLERMSSVQEGPENTLLCTGKIFKFAKRLSYLIAFYRKTKMQTSSYGDPRAWEISRNLSRTNFGSILHYSRERETPRSPAKAHYI